MLSSCMKRALAFVLLCLITSAASAETITVAAAISLKDALAKVAERYKSDTGEAVEFTYGSSGQLATQIRSGAPIDLFISAANKQIDDLAKVGMTDDATRTVVAGNALVLIVPPKSNAAPDSLKALADPGVKHIAIGEPKTVPAGQYAQQALEHTHVADALKDRLIFGANVRQVLAYVEHGEAAAGIVYATDAKVAGEKVRVTCTIDAADHEAIVYPAAVVKASSKQAAAKRFLDYVASDKAQACLKEFGFAPPPKATTKPIK
jgi:molybdate transport system substrate-binding protein